MAAADCPHCHTPMTQAEFAGGSCPLCGQSLQVVEVAPAVTPNAPPLLARLKRNKKNTGAAWSLALLLMLINGGVWYAFFNSKPKATGSSPNEARILADHVADPKVASSTPPVDPATAQQVDADQSQDDLPVPTSEEHTSAPAARANGLDVPFLPRLPHPVAPDAQADDMNVHDIEGEDVVLFRPAEAFSIRRIDDGRQMKLRGKVKILRIHSINGKSTLDASQLEVEQISITGSIDGGSIVKLHAPAGKVTIRGTINGQSKVEIIAPGGSVTFDTYKPRPATVAFINGESLLEITAKDVKLAGAVEGTTTRVHITLTRDGSLSCGNIGGQSQLIYRKDQPGDPDPRIFTGQISSAAKLQRVE